MTRNVTPKCETSLTSYLLRMLTIKIFMFCMMTVGNPWHIITLAHQKIQVFVSTIISKFMWNLCTFHFFLGEFHDYNNDYRKKLAYRLYTICITYSNNAI